MNFLTDRGDCDISREFPIATEKFALGTEAAAFPHSHPMQSWDDSESTCPGPSLWSLIAEHAAESELPKIHAALGCSLVDMYTESHAEAVMWSNMWREKQQGSSRACTPLPDPPAIKELVRAEVQMLLQNLKTKVNGEGRSENEVLARYKTRTLRYVLAGHDCGRSPEDAVSESRANSQCSVRSSGEEEIDAVKEKLNATDIDEVVEHIRSALRHQCEQLQRQVQLIQGSFRKQCRSSGDTDPTLSELKKLRGALQTDLELHTSPALSTDSTLPCVMKDGLGRRSEQRTPAFRPHPPVGLRLKSTPSLRHRASLGGEQTHGPTQHQEEVLDYSKQSPQKTRTFQDHRPSCAAHDQHGQGSAQGHVTGNRLPPLHISTCPCSENGCCRCIHSQDFNESLGSFADTACQSSAREMCSPLKTPVMDVWGGRTARDGGLSSPVTFESVSLQGSGGVCSRDHTPRVIQQLRSTASTQHQSVCVQPELKLFSPKPPLGSSKRVLGSKSLQERPSVPHRQPLRNEC